MKKYLKYLFKKRRDFNFIFFFIIVKLLYGTDEQLIKVYNKESRSIIHEFKMDDQFPRYFYIYYIL